ncbi:response regulator transcription factor [Carboxydochorda subterranea]|uniref:Response regulator transcription factor n=1 Tax=Carboxydichorda subterranea TaxID=3109565 RepID=A0ABZ1C261_9FIRM|nr:response regulator transcription factor [Limnochorda sp. L945t]WRP18367.1 response regulator transcription factor [Limnochorda sp. L945t]
MTGASGPAPAQEVSWGPSPRVLLLGFRLEEASEFVPLLSRLGFRIEIGAEGRLDVARGVPGVRDIPGARAERMGFDVCPAEADLALVYLEQPESQAPPLIDWLSRRWGMPVVVLSDDARCSARIATLRAGAEDYVCRPFSASELALRLRAIYRRTGPRRAGCPQGAPGRPGTGPGTARVGDLVLDRTSRLAFLGGREIPLTGREFDLLWLLASHPGRVFSREELLLRLWGDEEAASEESVTVLISRLRAKLRMAGSCCTLRIRALWGVGYRLESERGALRRAAVPDHRAAVPAPKRPALLRAQ